MEVVLGVDIGGTNMKLCLLSCSGKVIEEGMIPTVQEEGVEGAASRVNRWLVDNSFNEYRLAGVGIGCAGLINKDDGVVISSPNLPGWEGASLKDVFKGVLGRDVIVENDANCAAFGEYASGAGKNSNTFVCITLGTGVGGGIIVDGKLLTGSRGFAGEIGHIVIDPSGPECGCGRRGCLEAFIGASAIVRMFMEELKKRRPGALADLDGITVRDISAYARDGDMVAIDVLKMTGKYLAMGLSVLMHLLNPDVVAVGGGVANAGELILEPARDELKGLLMHRVLGEVKIVRAELGSMASALGSAFLAREVFCGS